MAGDSLLWDVARSLYAAAPPDFVDARNQQVRELKKSGDDDAARQVAAFKKPTAAAALVNRVVRNVPDLTDEVVDLGTRLRTAQTDAATLRDLGRERRELVARWVTAAGEEAVRSGKAATAATLRDVEQTVWAAIIDPRAAAIVQAGVLVRALSAGGFSEVDVAGASALDVQVPTQTAPPAHRAAQRPTGPTAAQVEALRRAEVELEEAQDSARTIQRELEQAVKDSETAQAAHAELKEQRERLREELADVERRLAIALRDDADRRAGLKTAERRRRSAAAAVDRALRRVDEATP
ncbi:hypothetical protein [Aeromicrobium sp. P5_D10]